MEQIERITPVVLTPSNSASADVSILFLDMVSYSRRVAENEAKTLDFMSNCFDAIRIIARRFRGELVKTMGDGALLYFSDVECAVDFGLELHRIVDKQQVEEAEPFLFRVGIHIGEVRFKNGDVFGQTVNIASRLQSIAEPGECIISKDVFSTLSDKSSLQFESIGVPKLKNITARIPAYRVLDPLQRNRLTDLHRFTGLNLIGTDGADPAATSKPLGTRARGILAYLALNSGGYETIERIETLFGGKEVVSAALTELAESETGLDVQVFPDSALIHLDVELDRTDLGGMLGDLRQNKVPERLILEANWPQEILAGLDDITPLLDSWLRITRERWKWLLLSEMERFLERTDPGNEQREQVAQIILLQEPGHESASLAKIECRLEHEDRGGALEEFKRLKKFLFEHYGISPGKRIRQLIQAIRGKAPAPEQPRTSDIPSNIGLKIVVHTFQDECVDSTAWEVSSFRDELIANLSRFRDWSVLDGSASLSDSTRASGNMIYDVEGRRHMSGDQPMMALILKEAENSRVIWSEEFCLSSENWHDVQHEVLRSIAAKVRSYISLDRISSTLGTSAGGKDVTDMWLRADRALMEWTATGAENADAIFREILRNHPDHAPSLYRIASISNIQHVIWPGRVRDQSEIEEADSFAARAVAIDPLDARVQRTVAWTAAMNGAFTRASMHLELAAKLNPSSPATLASCAMGFAWFGDYDKAKSTLTQCEALSELLPSWCWAYHASTYFFLDRLEDALRAAELGGDSIPDTQGWLAAVHARRGDMDRAGRAFQAFWQKVSEHWTAQDEATPERVATWFTQAFPIKELSDQQKLGDAIQAARLAAY